MSHCNTGGPPQGGAWPPGPSAARGGEPRQSSDWRFALLLACFFGSGFAALVYEIAWTRQFSFVFGTSELAVATVLAGYMAGLAAGAGLAGRIGPRIRRPLLAYALLELGIGATALLVPAAIALARLLYVAVFGGAELADEAGLLRSLFYLGCSFAILLVPTSLMGATLPLLARYAVRSNAQLGPRIGLLYTTNTLGAVLGTVVSAFLLLPALGLSGSVRVAIAANAALFLGGLLLARGAAPVAFEAAPAPPLIAMRRDLRALILPIMLLSGAAAFTYEVLWTRLLGHLLGGSVYAFATMLAAFLGGIALGSLLASGAATDRRRAASTFAWAQAGAAALSVAAFHLLDWMPALAMNISGAERRTLLSDAVVAALTLLPATVCIGATFPLAVRILAPDEAAASAASARVYAWNTVGAVAGAIGAGFFLLPALGFVGTLRLAGAVNLAMGLAAGTLLVLPRPRAVRSAAAATAAAATALIVLVVPREPWNILRSSPLEVAPAEGPVVFHSVGRAATVTTFRRKAAWELRTNGLSEAIIQPRGGREAQDLVVHWLGALPCLARPAARRMMVVGLGGGVVLESIPRSVQRIDVVEIEPQVVMANRALGTERARDPLSDPRMHVIINDARDALTLSAGRYDVIVSQPSHPWTAAAANLYTREFFALCAEHLAPDGVLVQWMGLPFVNESLLRSIVATLREVFTHVRVYRPHVASVAFLASNAAFDFPRSAPQALAFDPEGYARLGIGCVEDVESTLILDEEGAAAFAAGARLITDDRNELAIRSPALVRGRITAAWLDIGRVLSAHDPHRRGIRGLEPDRVVRRLMRLGFRDRAILAAQSTAEPALQALCRARVELASDPRRAGELVAQALSIDGRLAGAWMLKLELDYRAGLAVAAAEPEPPGVLFDSDRAVLDGWARRDAGDWPGLQALDRRLAGIGSCDPFFEEAVRLRVAWRLADGDPALGLESMELIDRVLAGGVGFEDLLRRARAAMAAEQWRGLVTTLYAIVAALEVQPVNRRIARSALDIVDAAAARGAREPEQADLRKRLQRALEGWPPERPGDPREGAG